MVETQYLFLLKSINELPNLGIQLSSCYSCYLAITIQHYLLSELLVLMAERKRGHHSGSRRTAEVGNGFELRDPRDVEIERLQQRIQELELQQEDRWSSEQTWETQDEGNPFSYVRGRRDRRGVNRQEEPLRSLGLRVEIPEFVGKSHPDDF